MADLAKLHPLMTNSNGERRGQDHKTNRHWQPYHQTNDWQTSRLTQLGDHCLHILLPQMKFYEARE